MEKRDLGPPFKSAGRPRPFVTTGPDDTGIGNRATTIQTEERIEDPRLSQRRIERGGFGRRAMTKPGRVETLSWISGQLHALRTQVVSDVNGNKGDASGLPGGGFVAYSLKATNGEPLRDTTLEELDITVENIGETRGFLDLAARCEELEWQVRIDRQYYSDHPSPCSIFRVVVDGWS